MSFSPCGNFLLYVTSPIGIDATTTTTGKPKNPGETPEDPSGGPSRGSLGGPSGGSSGCLRQEVGIIDFFGDECQVTCVPLKKGSVCDEPPAVLLAFWAPGAPGAQGAPRGSAGGAGGPPHAAEAHSLIAVITQKNVELFKASWGVLLTVYGIEFRV